MRTFILSDDEATTLGDCMRGAARAAESLAASVKGDAGGLRRHAAKIAALSRKVTAPPETAPAKSFTRGGYSFRPVRQHETGLIGWVVFIKGERSVYSERAFIDPASDGTTYTVNMANVGHRTDARPSFREACDLVMARLPREG